MPAFATKSDARGRIRMKVLRARMHASTGKAAPGTLARHDDSWRVTCGSGELELTTVQLNRGKGTPLSVADAARGYPSIFAPDATFDVVNDVDQEGF